jgi:hypothetical protein
MKKMLMIPAFLMAFGAARAQEGDSAKSAASAAPDVQTADAGEEMTKLKGQVDGLNESYLETKTTVDKLAKIKLSGYIQAQWQHTDTNGAASVAGGAFPANSDQRFLLRRGRLKTTYETPTSKYVLQFDVIPTGLSLKDAYLTLTEPWLKTFSYTMGVFDRPFGYEISYSSSSRESPERSRVFQTVFPGERDLGAKLEINPSAEMGFLQYFNLKGGVFTGMGPTANEIDAEQDIIGRVGFKAPFYDLNLSIDGGFSLYAGKSLSVNDTAFSIEDTSFVRTMGNLRKTFDRKVMGVDAQLYYDLPVIGGLSLRGEYLWGEMPGTSGSSGPYAAATAPLFSRNFSGWYAMWVQNVGNKVQGVLKYDYYDPNTDVKGDNVQPVIAPRAGETAPGATDLAYGTLGYGVIFHWDENLKFTFYHDLVTNEEAGSLATGGSAAFKKDRKDNVFTFRGQVKF